MIEHKTNDTILIFEQDFLKDDKMNRLIIFHYYQSSIRYQSSYVLSFIQNLKSTLEWQIILKENGINEKRNRNNL